MIKLNETEEKVLNYLYNEYKIQGMRPILHWSSSSENKIDDLNIDRLIIAMESLETKGYISVDTPANKRSWSLIYTIKERLLNYFESNDDIQTTNQNHDIEFINSALILELESSENIKFNISILTQMLKEVNINYRLGNYFSIGLLLRSILNHIPPLFGTDFDTIDKVVNNSNLSKTTKEKIKHLNTSVRKLGDDYTHKLISNQGNIPTIQSINYIADFDYLVKVIINKLNNK